MNTKIYSNKDQKKSGKEQYTLLLGEEKQGVVFFKKKKKQQEKPNAWFYLGFVGQIGYTIALPIAGGALFGSYIDRVRGTYPKATLFFLFIGSMMSLVGFVSTIQYLIKKSNS